MHSLLNTFAVLATLCVTSLPVSALADRITVGAFEIDLTEVTVSEFTAFEV